MSVAEIQLTDEFQQCLDAVENGENVFVTGKAGTGKSTLLRLICEQQNAKQYAVVAPTGVAALNVDGETIHKCFGFRPELNAELTQYRPPNHLKELNMLVIDEVSMAKADLVDMVDRSLKRAKKDARPFGGVQMVLVGDLFQLPPVQPREDPDDDYYATPFFFSSRAIGRTPLTTIELTTVFRQKDEKFISILNAIRDGSVKKSALDELNRRVEPNIDTSALLNSITLAARNTKVSEINEHQLSILSGDETVYRGEQDGEADAEKHKELKELKLKPGAQVMMLINQHGYVNGSLGKILSLSDEVICVEIEGLDRAVDVGRYTWRIFDRTRRDEHGNKIEVGSFSQFPMKLAWAVTVHKSQGKTFNRVVFDSSHSSQPGQTYVALSRCTSLEGLVLTRKIEPHHVKVSPHVLRFHRRVSCKTKPIDSFPKAFVGIVTTGNDQYRKLVEVAVIRHDEGLPPIVFSTLINPHRDLCDAADSGLAASDLTLCPDIAEARGFIALMLSGAVPIGFRVDDLLELSGWSGQAVAEGIPFNLPLRVHEKSPALNGTNHSSDAMTLAAAARDDFLAIEDSKKANIQASPFVSHNHEIDDGSFILARSPAAAESLILGDRFQNLSSSSKVNLVVGLSVSCIADGITAEVRDAIENVRVSQEDCEEKASKLFEALVTKAEHDAEITDAEAATLGAFIDVWHLHFDAPKPINHRGAVQIKSGMVVCLTGKSAPVGHPCHGWKKAQVKEKAEPLGLKFIDKVTKRGGPDIVALLDMSQESRKAENARGWGIPVVSWKHIVEWAERQNS